MFHVEHTHMEELKECPVCAGKVFEPFIICKDFTVSGEKYSIVKCTSCGFLFTNPRPGAMEIGKYYESEEYISHSNSKEGFLNKIYQFVRKKAIADKIKLIQGENKGLEKKILDIGCGTGEFLQACKENGWKSRGVEPNEKARTFAQITYGLNILDETQLKALQDTFSIITMWHVLEHVHELQERVMQLNKLLKTGGTAIIAVPNPTSADALNYKEFWAAYDVPRHLYHFSPSSIKNLFSRHGFSHVKSLPMKYDSFYVSMLSEKYRHGTNNLTGAFFNGLKSNLKAGANPEKYSSVIYIFKKI